MQMMKMNILHIYAYADYSEKYAYDADAEYEYDITGRTIWCGIISVECL